MHVEKRRMYIYKSDQDLSMLLRIDMENVEHFFIKM